MSLNLKFNRFYCFTLNFFFIKFQWKKLIRNPVLNFQALYIKIKIYTSFTTQLFKYFSDFYGFRKSLYFKRLHRLISPISSIDSSFGASPTNNIRYYYLLWFIFDLIYRIISNAMIYYYIQIVCASTPLCSAAVSSLKRVTPLFTQHPGCLQRFVKCVYIIYSYIIYQQYPLPAYILYMQIKAQRILASYIN